MSKRHTGKKRVFQSFTLENSFLYPTKLSSPLVVSGDKCPFKIKGEMISCRLSDCVLALTGNDIPKHDTSDEAFVGRMVKTEFGTRFAVRTDAENDDMIRELAPVFASFIVDLYEKHVAKS